MPPRKPKMRIPKSTDHLVTDFPRVSLCGSCRAVIYRGHVFGMLEMFDPYPLTDLGEIEAMRRGLWTYILNPSIQRFRRRTAGVINASTILPGYILRSHVCGYPAPQGNLLMKPPPKEPEDIECPF